MTREDLYVSIGAMDDDLLERSEKAQVTGRKMWKRLLPLAACFGVVLLSAALLGREFRAPDPITATDAPKPTQAATEAATMPTQSLLQPTGPATVVTEPTRETVPPISPDSWEVVYNEVYSDINTLIATPFGYFTEELSREQIELLLPDALRGREDISGTAHYKAGNELWYAAIHVPVGDYSVTVLFEEHPTCMLGKPEGVTSVCGDVEYYVMEWMWEKKIKRSKYIPTETPGVYMVEEVETGEVERLPQQLEAEATINGVPVFFLMSVNIRYSNGDAEKQAFKEVLSAFATYPEQLPASSELTPLEPQNSFGYVYYGCSLEEARKDETFGSYLPRQMPENWKIILLEREYWEERNINSLRMEVVTEEQIRFSWSISEAGPLTVLPQSQAEVTRLMMENRRIDLNYGGVSVCVWAGYDEEMIDCQWLWEQLAALPVKPLVRPGLAGTDQQRRLELR